MKQLRAQRLAIVAIASTAVLACGTKTLTTSVDPSVATYALMQHRSDVNPAHTCTPVVPPEPLAPQRWYDSLPPVQLPKAVGNGVVGFDLWRNTTGQCEEFRQDLYRSVFWYDLSALQNLKGLVTKAELTFSAAVLPSAPPNSMCQAMTGGGGSLLVVRPPYAKPAGPFVDLPTPPPNADINQLFPSGAKVFAMNFPWVPGQIAPGVTTAAGQGASFTVDVTAQLNGAFARSDSTFAFVVSGSDEVPPTAAPPARFDCRTWYHFGQLTITHL